MIVELVSVGTELLLGDILNTNVQFLSKTCAQLGLDVYHYSAVGDNPNRLKEEIIHALSRSDCVILTGGLGSTSDDITKRIVLELVDQPIKEDPANRDVIAHWFSEEKDREENRIVYSFPERAQVLPNHVGTASGAWIPYEDKIIVILPGPPKEMQPMVRESLVPLLSQHSTGVTYSQVLKFGLIGEHQLSDLFHTEIEEGRDPTIAPYVKEEGAQLRLTAKAKTLEDAKNKVQKKQEELAKKARGLLLLVGEQSKEEALVEELNHRKELVSCGESLTGGLLASTIINVAGASSVLERSFVTYSDRAKMDELFVREESLLKHTAVSKEVCREMLEGIYRRSKADLCLATTGYAGPGGEELGHVFIGVRYHDRAKVFEFHFHGGRNLIRARARNYALDLALMELRGDAYGKDYQRI